MVIPPDYIERTYAGVLGKIIGVYLGRPFEGWGYDRIMEQLGEVDYYVHDKLAKPLVVTDDDISGTFTFVRAMEDHGNRLDLTAEEIGRSWMNYLIEKKTILWWGGLGNSSEHTAYLRLKNGIQAPMSGSIATNGPIVAEQIGAQIFIDGWAMISPGDPQRAADLARRAGSVSHDGEAIYGAQVLAAMEAQAYVESDINKLIDTGVSVIPKDSVIYRMIADLRGWYAADGDWRKTFQRIVEHYGYKDYVGGCHMVPNHALIILGLLYGEGDFQKSLMVCNTCGWDTDCNSGNLGCLLGIRNGLAGFEGQVDWRGPVADRIYLPTADGGRCVTDAVTETYHIVNMARALEGLAPVEPKGGARFHFNLPGSLQGVTVEKSADCSPYIKLQNVGGHSRKGSRSLAMKYSFVGERVVARASLPTFIAPQDLNMQGYELIASPTLYPGQTIEAALGADESNPDGVEVRLCVEYYDLNDQPGRLYGPCVSLEPGAYETLQWKIPAFESFQPEGVLIYAVGIELARPAQEASEKPGVVYIDSVGWTGTPEVTFKRLIDGVKPALWRANWVNGVEQWELWGAAFRLIQNSGRGLINTGTREWTDYRVSAKVLPALVKSGGIAARVQGMTRFYALQLAEGGKAQLLKAYEGNDSLLGEADFDWKLWKPYDLSLEVKGSRICGWVEGKLLFDVEDANGLASGGIGLVLTEGHMMAETVRVESAA
jgi:ADP-ribosylglycohydrolase